MSLRRLTPEPQSEEGAGVLIALGIVLVLEDF